MQIVRILKLTLKYFASLESCPGQMVEITGRAGLFLQGRVTPELEGVEISIKQNSATESFLTVLTDESGTYRYIKNKKLIHISFLLN